MNKDLTKECHILLVDDDPAHRKLALRAVKRGLPTCKVHEADSLDEALEIFNTMQSSLSLVILDLNLGSSSGFDVLRCIRKTFNFDILPVLINSTSAMESDIHRSYMLGANCYLVKSVDTNEYQSNIERALRFFWK